MHRRRIHGQSRRPANTDPVGEQNRPSGGQNHPGHNPNPYKFYRVGALAQLFSVNRSTIWRWRRSGILPPFVKFGSLFGLTESQLAEVIQRQQQLPRGAA
jgi:predicted DNA-binding transcriptional regulator AlpA